MNMFKPKKDNAHEIFQYGFVSGKEAERERIVGWLMSHGVGFSYMDDNGGLVVLDYRTADLNKDKLREILWEEKS